MLSLSVVLDKYLLGAILRTANTADAQVFKLYIF